MEAYCGMNCHGCVNLETLIAYHVDYVPQLQVVSFIVSDES